MARRNQNTQTRNRRPRTFDELVAYELNRANENLAAARQHFLEAFEKSGGRYAVEWHAYAVVRGEAVKQIWDDVSAALGREGRAEALKCARHLAETTIQTFLGGQSTSPWHNACRRTEAEACNEVLRRQVHELERLAREEA
jgi:hypothetical protein